MKSVVMGAGTYGEVYCFYLQEAGVDVVGFLDDDPRKLGSRIAGLDVIGTSAAIEGLRARGIASFYCPIGVNQARVILNTRARQAGLKTPNFIHRTAKIDSPVPSDSGIYILPSVVAMPCSSFEMDVMISTNVTVAHHTTLKQGVFLSTNVSVGASMVLQRNVYVGMSATLVTGKVFTVGENAFIGAGAVVVANVGCNETVAGVPAKVLRKKDDLVLSKA